MSESPIAAIELIHVRLPTRREHKWTGLYRAYRRLHARQDDGPRWPRRLGRGARAEGLGRRVRPLFRRKPRHGRARWCRTISRPRSPAACRATSSNCMTAWTVPSRAIPMPRRRSISPPTTLPACRSACRRCRLLGRRAAPAHRRHPFDRSHRLRGGRARGHAGRRRGNPHIQGQGRRRSGPRRRDGAAPARHGRAEDHARDRCQSGLRDARRGDPHLPPMARAESPISSSRSKASRGLPRSPAPSMRR